MADEAFRRARAQMNGSGFRSFATSVADSKDSKEAFDEAYKTAEQQRKLQTSEARTQIATERLGVEKDRQAASQELAKQQAELRDQRFELKQTQAEASMAKENADLALAKHKLEAEMNVTKQTSGMFTKMETLRDAKGFLTPSAISSLRAEFPDAAMHANNAPALEHEVNRYDANQKFEAALPKAGYKTVNTLDANGHVIQSMRVPVKPGEADDINRPILQSQHDALVTSIGDNGWNATNATKINQLNAIKTQLGYVPVDVKGVTDVAQPAASPAAQPPAAPATQPPAAGAPPATAPPVTPLGPAVTDSAAPAAPVVDHNAALDWAKANPDDPRATAIRARNGL